MAKKGKESEIQSENKVLRRKIAELEKELQARQEDLQVFRKQLAKANQMIETMLAHADSDLKMATHLQRLLLPTEIPPISGFEFSTKFIASPVSGGDYFDIFELEDKMKFGIILSSCSGYGLSALLMSSLLRMTSTQLSRATDPKRGQAPHEVIQDLAQELAPSFQLNENSGNSAVPTQSASLFYAVFDRRNMTMSYASVGPIWVGHYQNEANKIRRLTPDNQPIQPGFRLEKLKSESLDLGSKDRIILASPGLAMGRSPEGDRFGDERILRSLQVAAKTSAHDWRNEILFRLDQFRSGVDLPRDVTVLVVEVKDRVIKLAPKKSR